MIGKRELVTPPATEPLTTAEAKTHARVTSSADDAYIDTLIAAARGMFEEQTGRMLITQTWRMWFDAPPIRDNLGWWDGVQEGALNMSEQNYLELVPNPVIAVSSVKSYGTDNTETTFSSANYFLDRVSKPARVILNAGQTWPTGLRDKNSLTVEFTAGYGAAATDVPADIRHLLKMAVLNLYEVRGDCADPKCQDAMSKIISPAVQKYRIRRL